MPIIVRGSGGGGGSKPELTVTAPTGSTVICTKGTKTVTAQEDSGTWLFKLPEFGEWTVTATKDGESASDTIDVQQDYDATLSYGPVASLTPKSGVTYVDGISTLTAEQMHAYGAAISNNANITNTTSTVYIDYGTMHYKVCVGDSINLTVSGVSYQFVVIGFNHDELATPTEYGAVTATGKSGFTLQMRNCLNTKYSIGVTNANLGLWGGCTLRTTLQSTIKNSMGSAWQSVTKVVKKPTATSYQNTAIIASNDTLFLLSEVEVFGSVTYSASGEGNQYAWYSAGNTKAKSSNGADTGWWERSPRISTYSDFCGVANSTASRASVTNSIGVPFAFCI